MARPIGTHRPSSVRSMSPVEASWVGAFIEADGNISIYDPHPHTDCSCQYVMLKVTQKDIEPIATILRLTKVGRVSYTNPSPTPTCDAYRIWRWEVNAQGDASDLVQQLAPYCAKAQKALPVIAWRYGGSY
mgnify:CR=1 FL=1